MTHNPKLVEALAAFMYRCARRFFLDAAPLWDDLTPHLKELWLAHAECMIEDHRLVQLPEEPIEWEVEWGSDEWIGFQTREDAVNFANENRPSTTGRIRAVRYVVTYSDPLEVEP